MKNLSAILLIILGIIVGLYVGFWVCLAGGIMGVISVITGTAGLAVLGWSLLKIVFAGLAGYLSGALFIVPGLAMLGAKSKRNRRFR